MMFSEKRTVQEPLIRYATAVGWKYISPEELKTLRQNNTKAILEGIFLPKLMELNPFLSEEEAHRVLRELEGLRTDIHGNLRAWKFLKGKEAVYVASERRNRNIRLIDTKNIHNNQFHLVEEFSFSNGFRDIRQDIVFFINGVPVAFVEAKAPHRIGAIEQAFDQVVQYHRACPQLLVLEQVFVLTHLYSFMYGATWNTSLKDLYNWKEERGGGFEELVKSFFQPESLVELLTEYVLFPERDGSLQKVVLRPHQVRAVGKILRRAKEDKRRGLVWHTQGSGKTYTMVTSARRLIEDPELENPTVLVLVDRIELEKQLFANFRALGLEVELPETSEDLKRLLIQGTRGIIVSTIHKFEDTPPNINTSKNIMVLIDEAHRSTSGKLGNRLMSALPNATYIGFTGTPIDRGKSTFFIFGREDPPHGYLDKYSIAESIADRTTLPLHYSFAPNDLLLERELLEREFLELKEAEGISDVEVLDRILDRAVNLKNALKSSHRIEKVAEYVARHYREHVEPLGYKAFLVAVDREACALYKKELDKHLPPEYSAVVYSQNPKDPDFMREYYLTEEEEHRIRESFRDPKKNPKILIVTNKLLTGFDAPILYCLYLDKPMRDHVFLQTIARVNRPYEDREGNRKPSGLIVDFVGIFANLEKALAFDSADVEGVVYDLEKLKDRFRHLMEFADFPRLKELLASQYSQDKLAELVVEYFRDDSLRERFYEFMREVMDIYIILSPDTFFGPYFNTLETLTKLYRMVRNFYDRELNVYKDVEKKVAELVRSHIKQGEIVQITSTYRIDEESLRALRGEKQSDAERVYNLSTKLWNLFVEEAKEKPYALSLADEVQRVIEKYKEGQEKTVEVLKKLEEIEEKYQRIEDERQEKSMSPQTYTIYIILQGWQVQRALQKAQLIKDLFSKYPHWLRSNQHERALLREIIRVLEPRLNPNATHMAEEIIHTMKRWHDHSGI